MQLKLWRLPAQKHRLKSVSCSLHDVVQRCNPSSSLPSFGRAQIGQLLRVFSANGNPFGIQNRRVLRQGDNFRLNVLSLAAWQSVVPACSFSLCVLDLLTLVQIFIRKNNKKGVLFVSPPSHFVIAKEQTLFNVHKVRKQWLLYLLSYGGWQRAIA